MSGTTLAFPTPASLGSLDHYIQAVNRFPLLSAEQEVELGRKLQRDNDLDAARQLVLSHLRLVVAVSRNYLGYGLPQGDLIQAGNIGLMKAVRRFDPARGVRLVSFALHWHKALAKLDDRSRRIIEARWLREDDQATLQDLADEYGVSAERIRQIESRALKTMRGDMAHV